MAGSAAFYVLNCALLSEDATFGRLLRIVRSKEVAVLLLDLSLP
jgi:hypothetical protein